MIDLANRAIRHDVIGFQRQTGQTVSNGDTNGINSYHCRVKMHGAALRMRTLALLTGISRILMLLGMNSTADKPCVLCKAEHRLRKKDENCAKAQRKKLIFAGDFHEPSPLSQGSRLVNSCLGTTDHSFCAGIHCSLNSQRQNLIEMPTKGLKSSAASVTPKLHPQSS